ncbi:protein VAC14 homolog [Humulus lupulus]|uniref:protein VAC14 homolog n=1 Tax=Humulus lupulus TaxID=3486 RepID=UPI002B40B551|nr:protein VAC14 homolog [Humulus lupulus]
MADSQSALLPAFVLQNLSDNIYNNRKTAAIEVEGIVKKLASSGDQEKIITELINILNTQFTYSPQPNHRKGGLIALACVTTGLSNDATPYLEQIVPPVLSSFNDQDSRIRYYACESLYNIAKVVRGDIKIFMDEIIDAISKVSADTDVNVQEAAHLVDRLVKDIVAESDQISVE